MRKILFILAFLSIGLYSYAQLGTQRAGLIYAGALYEGAGVLGENVLQGALKLQYNYIGDKEQDIADWQQAYSDYLDKFQDVLQLAACFYAIYYEVNEARKNLNAVSNAIKICPTGVFAAAFKKKRNNVMRQTGQNIVEMTTSIVKVFTNKMNQKQRFDEIYKIERMLQTFNSQLSELAIQIRYTSIIDLWDEFMGKAHLSQRRDHGDVALDCMYKASLRAKERYLVWNKLRLK